MNLSIALAWRNLWRHKRRTWLTIGAMTLCNVVLIFMMSLQGASYLSMLDNNLSMFAGYLQIQHPDYLENPKPRHSINEGISLASDLRSDNIQAAARGISVALLSTSTRSKALQVVGVEANYEGQVSTLPGTLKQGKYLTDDAPFGIVISALTAKHLQAALNSELTLLGSGQDGSMAASIVNVVGIYDSGMIDVDRNMVFINLNHFQEIFSFGDDVSYITINAKSIFDVDALETKITTILGNSNDRRVVDWDQIMPGLKQAIQSDITSAIFIYLILVIVVIFSVLNNQLMAVMERRREYGILLSLGVRHSQLVKLLLIETAFLSLAGLALGVLLGGSLDAYLNHVGISFEGMEEMTQKFNMPSRLYPTLHPLAILTGPLIVTLGSLLAATYPAIKLFRLQALASRYAA